MQHQTIPGDPAQLEKARQLAAEQIRKLASQTNSPLHQSPRKGFNRGVNFYGREWLPTALALSMHKYQHHQGYFPNLLNARGFSEKLFQSKFLREFKVPQSGNKLRTAEFIPGKIAPVLKCPTIVWYSPVARLPENDAVAPGAYFLKASHGSGMFRRITYPLDAPSRLELEGLASQWLQGRYGFTYGQWWYSAFRPFLLLEQAIGSMESSLSYNVYTFGDAIGHIVVWQKTLNADGKIVDASTQLDTGFTPLPEQNASRPRARVETVGDRTKQLILDCASAIGEQFSFARVDFLVTDDGDPVLGEVTFCPGDITRQQQPERNALYGDLWDKARMRQRTFG